MNNNNNINTIPITRFITTPTPTITTSHWKDLYQDMIISIAAFLQLCDLIHLLQVNQHYKKICYCVQVFNKYEVDIFKNNIVVDVYRNNNPNTTLQYLSQIKIRVPHQSMWVLTDYIELKLLSNINSISIEINCLDDSDEYWYCVLEHKLKKLPNLKKTNLYFFNYNMLFGDFISILPVFEKTITKLYLGNICVHDENHKIDFQTLSNYLFNLQELKLECNITCRSICNLHQINNLRWIGNGPEKNKLKKLDINFYYSSELDLNKNNHNFYVEYMHEINNSIELLDRSTTIQIPRLVTNNETNPLLLLSVNNNNFVLADNIDHLKINLLENLWSKMGGGYWLNDINILPFVRELTILQCAACDIYKVGSTIFGVKFPNLNTLNIEIRCDTNYYVDMDVNGVSDILLAYKNVFLENLCLIKNEIKCLKTINLMNPIMEYQSIQQHPKWEILEPILTKQSIIY